MMTCSKSLIQTDLIAIGVNVGRAKNESYAPNECAAGRRGLG